MIISIHVLNVRGTKFSLRGDMTDGVMYQQSLILDPLHFPLTTILLKWYKQNNIRIEKIEADCTHVNSNLKKAEWN